VVTRLLVGSYRRIAPLYVSQTAADPSGSSTTPSGCWNRASPAGPSRWPKSNRPVPTWVVSPVADQVRSADVSESATQTRCPSAEVARPDG
jgi:hypothetical protein